MITGEITAQPRWFCLKAQPRRENAAAVHLGQRVGIDVFAPRINVPRSSRASRVAGLIAEALFPGYLFAKFRYPQQLRHVVSTNGVSGIVSFGSEPPAVADGVIDFLRAQVALAQRDDTAPLFAEGAWVRVVAGCFHDMDARVLSFDSRTERVRILLSLLGRDVQVSVLVRQLAPVGKAAAYPAGLLVVPRTAAPLAQ